MTAKPSATASRRRAAATSRTRARSTEAFPAEAHAGRETELFAVPGVFDRYEDRDSEPMMATLYRPTEVQMLTLARIGNALKSGDAPTFNILLLADEMISSLFAYQEEWDRFERARIRADVSDEEYVEFVREVLTRFLPAQEEAPTTGPAPTRRKAVRR